MALDHLVHAARPDSETAVLHLSRRLHIAITTRRAELRDRLSDADERGEGVISMAIAILIVAFLGAAAWLAFKGLLDGTKDKAEAQLDKVGG